jgi:hypothetical protein
VPLVKETLLANRKYLNLYGDLPPQNFAPIGHVAAQGQSRPNQRKDARFRASRAITWRLGGLLGGELPAFRFHKSGVFSLSGDLPNDGAKSVAWGVLPSGPLALVAVVILDICQLLGMQFDGSAIVRPGEQLPSEQSHTEPCGANNSKRTWPHSRKIFPTEFP